MVHITFMAEHGDSAYGRWLRGQVTQSWMVNRAGVYGHPSPSPSSQAVAVAKR